MSIREFVLSKSELGSEPALSKTFESNDCFLQILGKDVDELPLDHYIRPFIPKDAASIGEIHFLPNGNATENPSNRTEILYLGLNAIEEYIGQFKKNDSIHYNFIYGRSDPQMASVAQWVGFKAIEDPKNSGSIIMYTTPEEIESCFAKLKTDGVLEKIKSRYKLLQDPAKNKSSWSGGDGGI